MATRVAHVFTVPDSLIFLRGQIAYMRRKGFEPTVITSPGPDLEAFGRREGVAVHGLPMARRITPGEDARTLARLIALFRRIRPDIVHAHTPKGGLLGTIAATAARIPARIYHMRGLPVQTATGAQRAILTTTERTSCALASHVLAVSASLRDEALSRGLVAAKKIRVLGSGSGNGVDATGLFDPARPDGRAFKKAHGLGDGPLVGFVGRLVRDKGVFELAEAWAAIRERFPSAELVVAGIFEERDAIPKDLRDRLENDRRVRMLGFVEDTPAFYAAMDVIAFPSHREGFPNVPLEAASMSVPIVAAAAVGTVDAVVDGETGTLFPIGNARALGDGLAKYLSDPALAERHGRAARERVLREFTSERVWENLADFYASL